MRAAARLLWTLCGALLWLWVKEGEKLPSPEVDGENGGHVPVCTRCFARHKPPDPR